MDVWDGSGGSESFAFVVADVFSWMFLTSNILFEEVFGSCNHKEQPHQYIVCHLVPDIHHHHHLSKLLWLQGRWPAKNVGEL